MAEDHFKQIVRRQDSIEKTVNLIYKHLDMLEDVSVRLGALEDKVKYLSDRVASLDKNIKADIKDVSTEIQSVKDNTEEIKETINEGGEE